jgi:hypothetical protein
MNRMKKVENPYKKVDLRLSGIKNLLFDVII